MKLQLLFLLQLLGTVPFFAQKASIEHNSEVTALTFSPDSKYIATATSNGIRVSTINGTNLFQLTTWNSVYCLDYSSDGSLIAAGLHGGYIEIWNNQGKRIKRFNSQDHVFKVTAIAFSFDGKKIVAGYENGEVLVWSLDGEIIQELSSKSEAQDKPSVIHPSDDVLMELGREEERKGRMEKEFEAYKKSKKPYSTSVTELIFSPKNQWIIVGSMDSTVRIWDAKGELISSFKSEFGQVKSISISLNEEKLLTTHEGLAMAILWDKQGKIIWRIRGHLAPIIMAKFVAEDQIATISDDGMIRIQGVPNPIISAISEALWSREYLKKARVSPDGKWVATLDNQNKVKVWDWSKPSQQERIFQFERDPITALAFSPAGDMFVSGGKESSYIKLWDSTGLLLQSFTAKDLWEVHSLAFAPDGQSFLAACDKGRLIQWHIDGTPIQLLSGGPKKCIELAFFANGHQAIAIGSDSMIMVWDLKQGTLIRKFSTRSSIVTAVVSSNRKNILIGDKMGDVTLWEPSGKFVSKIISSQKGLKNIATSKDKQIMLGFEDNSISLWSFKGEMLKNIRPPSSLPPEVKFSPLVKFSSDGKQLFLSDIWNGVITDLEGQGAQKIGVAPNAAAFNPRSKQLIVGYGNDGIKSWDTQGKLLHTISGSPSNFKGLAFHPTEKLFYTLSTDGEAIAWDYLLKASHRLVEFSSVIAFHTGAEKTYMLSGGVDGYIKLLDDQKQVVWSKMVADPYDISCVAFSPNGETIFVGRENTGYAQLWNLQGKLMSGFFGHNSDITSGAFAPDGLSFVTGSLDSTAVLWDLEGNKLQTFKGHSGKVTSVAFSPDGKSILTGGGDAYVKIWDLNGQMLQSFHNKSFGVNSVAFSPDGKYILTGNKYTGTPATLWDLKGNSLREYYKGNSIKEAFDARFSPDGKYIVLLLRDTIVLVEAWRPE